MTSIVLIMPRAGSCLLAACFLAAPSWGQDAGRGETFTLGRIEIHTGDIYPEGRAESALRRLINATHWTTREAVVRREIWHRPGEVVDLRFAQELERNLRATGLFADVVVELVPSTDPNAPEGTRDLRVRTRDQLSLGLGAGASFVGDATSGNASVSESNFLGIGDRIRLSVSENDFGETVGQASYRDRYVAGTWTTADFVAGRTDQGDFFSVGFSRPFRFLEDRFSWDVRAGKTAYDQDYFFRNSTVAEVPVDLDNVQASASWRAGTRMNFWTRGLTTRYQNAQYSAARGVAAPQLRVPGDTESVFAGGTLSWANLSEFREVQYLDTIRFIQDVQVGTTAFLEAGAYFRDEASGGSAPAGDSAEGQSTQTQISTRLSHLIAPGETRFASASVAGSIRTDGGDTQAWRTDVELRAFDLTWHPHTLAFAVSYTQAEEDQGLPVQLTLGERSGLRGYPNRQLVGDQVLLLHLEDRIDLDASIRSFDFGAVIFGDAAWVGGQTFGPQSFEGPYTSAGVGLRIGSTPLLGRGVLRVDLSFPFDDVNGESFDPLFSATLGQVFTL
ncbi:Outer membrane protein assembly factor BamA [Planctomycetes bacterium Poly30]|uniref:Outer membrane protein assembly factor BamA n=1 Tax=Saltatorellus ferox TaxID=2528018 RepID=A0A518END5_9BACT|nr:Outer membrane protein assembly factor BamA [Planctomycetes bacterium Poly30]